MADKLKESNMWLKILNGLQATLIVLLFGFTSTKVDKYSFELHEKYQKQQFDAIEKRDKERHDAVIKALERIEGTKNE